MKLGIDAMSGDLGSAIVVEACRSFLRKKRGIISFRVIFTSHNN